MTKPKSGSCDQCSPWRWSAGKRERIRRCGTTGVAVIFTDDATRAVGYPWLATSRVSNASKRGRASSLASWTKE